LDTGDKAGIVFEKQFLKKESFTKETGDSAV
jgi:hypothetical protein